MARPNRRPSIFPSTGGAAEPVYRVFLGCIK